MAVFQEFALAVFLGLAPGHFGFGCRDLGFRDLEVLPVLLRVEPGEEIVLLDLRPDIDGPFEDLAVDPKAEIGLIAGLDLAGQRYLLPPSCNSTVTVRTGRTACDAAFSSLWQAAKADSKMRVPAAPSARVSKRLERSPARLVPHIIGKALGLGWLTDGCSIGDAARTSRHDF